LHLTDLFHDLLSIPANCGNPAISGLAVDTRRARGGDVFFALVGGTHDGRSFITDALRIGVSAIVTDDRPMPPDLVKAAKSAQTPVLTCPNPRQVMARAAARFWPAQPGMIAAITGTNGKTSTAEFLRQLWCRATWQAVALGTLGITGTQTLNINGSLPGMPSLTTPDSLSLHAAVNQLAKAGATHLALEASSHGLEQHRLDGLNIHVVAFTNLSRDHLDHHADMHHYFAAKLRLFTDLLKPGGCAVINLDDPKSAKIIRALSDREIVIKTYGYAKDAQFRVDSISPSGDGLEMHVTHQGQTWHIPLAMSGTFQALNALAAAVMAHASGLALHDSLGGLPYLKAAPGRMQTVRGHPHGARVIVDYAHTPDALAAALDALRPEASGRLVALFGCGGDRDPGKRALMGTVAAANADRIIITDDNPRSEDPAAIRAAIIEACPGAEEITPRDTAITAAINDLRAGDVLLIAGKGHESVQLIGTETLPFDDAAVAKNAIDAMREAL
jgi:UDP-N-acetylmuramoyl-L-alanyl-D-glutamate--2,6-diaminopimelate ligase